MLVFAASCYPHSRKQENKKNSGEEARRKIRGTGGPQIIEARSDTDMFCPNCGNRMKEGAAFCTNCGAKIQAGAPNVCTACGVELPEGTAFCIECGKAVNREAPESAGSSQAAPSAPPQSGAGLVGFSDR
ncbi:MAG: zinc-ribbon domain-containing protein, partial [Oscillospiraceae bacterium]